MASYVVTGASRGIGYEFIRQLSSDPSNTVIGLVRNAEPTKQRVSAELNRSNIHILQADVNDYDALKAAVADVSKITGGSLDYVIANAGAVSEWSANFSLTDLGAYPKKLEEDLLEGFKTNVIGSIHLFNLFTPLILKGKAKKVVALTTGMADPDLINNYSIYVSGPYSISKAALNVAIAKYNAEFGKDGVLFMAISPGLVDTGHLGGPTAENEKKGFNDMLQSFGRYAPHFTGPITPEESVKSILGVVTKASVENGDGGSFVSHLGTKQWL